MNLTEFEMLAIKSYIDQIEPLKRQNISGTIYLSAEQWKVVNEILFKKPNEFKFLK